MSNPEKIEPREKIFSLGFRKFKLRAAMKSIASVPSQAFQPVFVLPHTLNDILFFRFHRQQRHADDAPHSSIQASHCELPHA